MSIQVWSECHELGHNSSTQMVFDKVNDLLVNSHGERMNLTAAAATHVEPSLNVTSDVFVEIIRLDVLNQGICGHVTQPKIRTILQLHVVIMGFIHDSLTQI